MWSNILSLMTALLRMAQRKQVHEEKMQKWCQRERARKREGGIGRQSERETEEEEEEEGEIERERELLRT